MKIENKKSEKILLIELEGFSQTETANEFVIEYNKAVAETKGNGYTLVVDSTNLSAFKPDILPILEKCYQLYMSSGFKQIFMINPSKLTCKMQVQRVAKKVNFTGIFVDSMKDIK
ncbi:hypothetical protein [Clostridium akagii]|uniref:hypothetical protein n=1 Tax=Clostridium akagii TaxID=91623 RepID=UPI00068C755D|nr:hypothetical protein [Clostridium akagii]